MVCHVARKSVYSGMDPSTRNVQVDTQVRWYGVLVMWMCLPVHHLHSTVVSMYLVCLLVIVLDESQHGKHSFATSLGYRRST